jgi:hypothetical protein
MWFVSPDQESERCELGDTLLAISQVAKQLSVGEQYDSPGARAVLEKITLAFHRMEGTAFRSLAVGSFLGKLEGVAI